MNPEISVVVHGLRYARHLERCLYSILMQTIQNVEVVVAIDCLLEDDIRNTLEQIANQDRRIRLLKNLSEDDVQILDIAVGACRGRYTLLASADVFYPYDAFQTMLDRAGTSGLIFNIAYKNNKNMYTKANDSQHTLLDVFLSPSVYQHLFVSDVLREHSISLQTQGFYPVLGSLLDYYTHMEPDMMTGEVLAYSDHSQEKQALAENPINTPHLEKIAKIQMEEQHFKTAFLTIGTLLAALHTEICSGLNRNRCKAAFRCLQAIARVYQNNMQIAAYFQFILKIDAGLVGAISEDFYLYAFQQEMRMREREEETPLPASYLAEPNEKTKRRGRLENIRMGEQK